MDDGSMKTFYDSEGYLVVNSLFTDAELADVRLRTYEIIADPARAPAGVSVSREDDTLADANRVNRSPLGRRPFSYALILSSKPFACHPKLLELVRLLLGPRIKVCLVSGHLHSDTFRHAGAHKIPNGGSSEIMRTLDSTGAEGGS